MARTFHNGTLMDARLRKDPVEPASARISVIICTIRRAALVRRILECLAVQTYRSVEVVIVGGEAGPDPDIQRSLPAGCPPVRLLGAGKGLACARNAGMANAGGDLLCFLDDDVVFEQDFLRDAAQLFSRPELEHVGGITGYDVANYPAPVSTRWRLRSLLRITPSLNPGDASRLGRSVPLTFFHPFSGYREVKWLPGFCQIYRRAAVAGLTYDEKIVVEDRDFSMQVGDKWKLLICGDLHLSHLQDDQARYSSPRQTWRAAFGLGRSFAKRRQSGFDWVRAGHVLAGEFLIDLLLTVRKPSLTSWKILCSRINGFVAGLTSLRGRATVKHL